MLLLLLLKHKQRRVHHAPLTSAAGKPPGAAPGKPLAAAPPAAAKPGGLGSGVSEGEEGEEGGIKAHRQRSASGEESSGGGLEGGPGASPLRLRRQFTDQSDWEAPPPPAGPSGEAAPAAD